MHCCCLAGEGWACKQAGSRHGLQSWAEKLDASCKAWPTWMGKQAGKQALPSWAGKQAWPSWAGKQAWPSWAGMQPSWAGKQSSWAGRQAWPFSAGMQAWLSWAGKQAWPSCQEKQADSLETEIAASWHELPGWAENQAAAWKAWSACLPHIAIWAETLAASRQATSFLAHEPAGSRQALPSWAENWATQQGG